MQCKPDWGTFPVPKDDFHRNRICVFSLPYLVLYWLRCGSVLNIVWLKVMWPYHSFVENGCRKCILQAPIVARWNIWYSYVVIKWKVNAKSFFFTVEFLHYIVESKSLRKVFVSIKGIYYQAEIMGQLVTWIVPHTFGFNVSYFLYCILLFYLSKPGIGPKKKIVFVLDLLQNSNQQKLVIKNKTKNSSILNLVTMKFLKYKQF